MMHSAVWVVANTLPDSHMHTFSHKMPVAVSDSITSRSSLEKKLCCFESLFLSHGAGLSLIFELESECIIRCVYVGISDCILMKTWLLHSCHKGLKL